MAKRIRLAEGCWQTPSGTSITVYVDGQQREESHPPGTPVEDLKRHRARFEAQLREQAATRRQLDDLPAPVRGTFKADVLRRLRQLEGKEQHDSDKSHLAAWFPFVGDLHRAVIKPRHVHAAVKAWLEAGKSRGTIVHRLRVFKGLYDGLDGAHALPPLQGAYELLPARPEPDPRPTAVATIVAVAQSLQRGLTHLQRVGPSRVPTVVHHPVPKATLARFLIRALTGARPVQIRRTVAADIDYERHVWWMRPAKGGRPVRYPMTEPVERAWRYFAEVNAWGDFDTSSFAETIRRHGWPEDERPYNLRHTFVIDSLDAGAHLDQLQLLLGHKRIDTTRRFYGGVAGRLGDAVELRRLDLYSSPVGLLEAPASQNLPESAPRVALVIEQDS